MKERIHLWWQKAKQRPFIIAGIVVALLVISTFIFAVYLFGWDWTGFTSGEGKIITTTTSEGITTTKELQPGKALWDWLGLLAALAIPVVVGIGAAWFTVQQAKVSDRENKDNQQEAALQAYIDKMSELLLEKKLRESVAEDEVRKIARVRTLTVLPRLDKERKGSVLRFLHESELIEKDKAIVDLTGANLNGANLNGANLRLTDLSGAKLIGTDLRLADLSSANLRLTDFSFAKLSYTRLNSADLSGAKLRFANLRLADLSGAKFSNTNLSGANLSGAIVTQKQLDKAHSLLGTTMPDGSIHA